MSISKLTTNGLTGTKYDTVSADNYYMEPIATTLVGVGGVSSVTFSNIPNTYKHLQIRMITLKSAADILQIELNGDTTTTNYYWHRIDGDGASVSAVSGNAKLVGYVGTTTYPAANVIDILDYANPSKFKVTRNLLGNDRNGGGVVALHSLLWNNTAPVNSILFKCDAGGNFAQYSRFSLYGIRG